jgi:MFS family permease
LLKRLRSGWRFLRQRRRLLWFGIGSYSVFTIVLVYSFFLLPQYVRLALGGDADVYGSAEMSFAAGALAAGFLTPPLMRRFGIVGPVQVLLGLGALVMTALAAFPHPTTLYLGTALFGGTNSALRILRITYILRKTPNGVVGRTNSLFSMVNIAERMLFLLLFSMPFFDSPQHIRWPFWGFALFCLASVGMIGWFFQMPRRRSPRPLSGKAAGQTLRDNA